MKHHSRPGQLQVAFGWEPDLNDGVRMNIRPFVEASVLPKTPRLSGPRTAVQTGERVNDVHLTNTDKRTARTTGEKPC